MMKTPINYVAAAMLILTAVPNCHAEETQQEKALRFVADFGSKQTLREFLPLSDQEKGELQSQIREQQKENPAGRATYITALALLGDEEALQHEIREFLANDGRGPGLLSSAENPRIIELVAPAFSGEEAWGYGGDVFVIPPSYRAAELTVEILANSPAFDGEVINWAQGLRGLTTTELRALIRPWWKENEKFFRQKNYKAVQPGPERPRDPLAYLTSDVEAPPQSPPPSPTAKPASDNFSPAAVTTTATRAESPRPSLAFVWTGAIGAFGLLAGLFVIWKRARSSPPPR